MRDPHGVRRVFGAAVLALALALGPSGLGCGGGGATPPPGRIHFPTAVTMSPVDDALGASRFLFVASSNFDLRFVHGSLAVYDLEILNASLDSQACRNEDADRCGILPAEDDRDDLAGLGIVPVPGLLVSEVHTGSYSAGLTIAEARASDAAWRLYMPVRSDANLTFVDVAADGRLRCGDDFAVAGAPYECRQAFRSGDDVTANARGIALPPDPLAIQVGPLSDLVTGADPGAGTYVLLAHRAGALSLFFDAPTGDSARPVLVHTLSGFPDELADVAFDPTTKLAWMPSAFDPFVARAGVAFDGATASPERSYLFDAGVLRVSSAVDTGTATRGDTRAIRFDPRPDRRRAYVISRRPRALLTVDIDDSAGKIEVNDIIPVGLGPSKIELALFPTPAGERLLAFVSCFDSRDLYVIDVDAGLLVGVVRAIGGPFDLAVDVPRQRLYVTDFRQSVMRVFDLSGALDCLDPNSAAVGGCAPRPLGVVGRPVAVEELR